MKPIVLFVVGPTASGKSQVAFALAKRFNGEIISADSMQVYRGMDIRTAKPSRKERQRIPHHLVDIRSPARLFSVFEFRKLALKKINQILKRGKLPIVAGGTGLYIRSLTQGLVESPAPDFRLRRALEKEACEKGIELLYERLKKRDPRKAKTLQPGDKKRIIRALEILQAGKKHPPSGGQKEAELSLAALGFNPVIIGINRDRSDLYLRINARVDLMIKKGLIAEAKGLYRVKMAQTSRQGVGYKELFFNFSQHHDIKEVKENIKKNTRHYAKRQLTWFRKEPGVHWFMWSAQEKFSDFFPRLDDFFRSKIS